VLILLGDPCHELPQSRTVAPTEEITRMPVNISLKTILGHVKVSNEENSFSFRLDAGHAIDVEQRHFGRLTVLLADVQTLGSTGQTTLSKRRA
jgi:hypothetical protein